MKRKLKYLTSQDFAKKVNRPYSTIAHWLRTGKIPGVIKLTMGGVQFWQIPETALKEFKIPSRGRPKGSKNKKSKPGRINHVA